MRWKCFGRSGFKNRIMLNKAYIYLYVCIHINIRVYIYDMYIYLKSPPRKCKTILSFLVFLLFFEMSHRHIVLCLNHSNTYLKEFGSRAPVMCSLCDFASRKRVKRNPMASSMTIAYTPISAAVILSSSMMRAMAHSMPTPSKLL